MTGGVPVFIHVGGDTIIEQRRLIAILDAQIRDAPATREFLATARRHPGVEDVTGGEAKSIIVTDRRVYLSPVSPLTLKRRSPFQK